MREVDTKTLDDATRRYTGLRRQYWQFCLAGLAVMAVLVLVMAILGALGLGSQATLRNIVYVPLALAFLACGVGGLVTWNSLMGFRCPRCDERFLLSSTSSWPSSACKHCGLYLG